MAISTNGTVIARLAGGLYNTVMSNATYLEVASQDPSTLANTLYARDFAKSTDLAVATTLLANLGLAGQAGLDAWVAAQLTAAGAANKGAKIVSLLNDFAGLASDVTWGTYATAFNTKVDAALAASQKTGSVEAKFETAGTVASTAATFALTTGVDSGALFTGGAGNDTFTANNAALGTLDSIDGGAGTDTLTITDSVSIPSLKATVANIEIINATSTAGSVGGIAVEATLAAKQQVTYFFDSNSGTVGSGPVKVTVGGASKTVVNSTAANANTLQDIAAAIDSLMDDGYGAATYATGTAATTGTIVVTSGTAGVPLPTIKFENGTYTPNGGTAVTNTTLSTTPATAGYSFSATNSANQVATAAVEAGTFSIPTNATAATISAVTSANVASVSTATTKVSGTDVTLSGGASQDVTAKGTVYASGTKGAVVVTNSAVETTATAGLYVVSSTTTGLNGGWGTSAAPVGGVLVTGGSTVNVTNAGGTIKDAAVTSGTTYNKTVQVGSAANKASTGSLTGTETVRNLALDPTGDVVISTKTNYSDTSGLKNVVFGTGAAKVYTNGGSSVSVTGAGTTTIVDVGTTTLIPSAGVAEVAGTSKLANVTLSGLGGNAAITSDAISTVTVTDTLAGRTVNIYNSGTTGANAGAINLVVSNAGTGTGANSITLDNATTTAVNISSAAASAYEKIGSTSSNSGSKSFVTLTTPKATKVTLTNSLSVDIGSFAGSTAGVAKVGTVDGSGATGAIAATIGAATAAGMNFTGGSGKDSVTLTGDLSVTSSTLATTVNLGAGDDKLLNSSATTTFTGASFSGGDGNDTVAISLMTVGNASKFTSFETVGLDATSGSRDVSIVAGATGLSLLATAASGSTVTYTGATTAQGLTVGTNMAGATGTLLLDFGSAVTAGTADAYTITFAGTGTTLATASATDIKASKVTIDGIEAVSLVSGGSGYTNNTIELKDTSAKTLTITGSQATGITFGSGYFGGDASTTTSTAGVSSIDASALTGKLTINTTNVRTANAGLSVKGGTNDDAITIANQASNVGGRVTVDAGTGDDTITTSTSAATLTGGAGKDTFKVSNTVATSAYLTAPVYTTITDYAAGDTIQMGTTSVVALKTVGVERVSTAISLEDAIAKAVVGNSTAGTVVWFAYGSDTFLVNDATGNGALDSADIIVKLTGLVDLTAASATGSGLVGVA